MNKTDVLAGSHIPLLVKLMEKTKGDVLELGIGINSTPLLHWLCQDQGRNLVSMETDRKWFQSFLPYLSSFHSFTLVADWDNENLADRHWGLVLVDHRPALRRRVEASRLATYADYILLHDSEPEINKFYGYTKIYPKFKYVYHYTKVKPHTTIVSNFFNPEELWK
jgi:hypothetical protein